MIWNNKSIYLLLCFSIVIFPQPINAQSLMAADSILIKEWRDSALANEVQKPLHTLVLLDSILDYSKSINEDLYFDIFEKCMEISTMRYYFSKAKDYLNQCAKKIRMFNIRVDSEHFTTYLTWQAYFELNTNLRLEAHKHFSEIILLKEAKMHKTKNDWETLFTAYGNLSEINSQEGNYNKSHFYQIKYIDIAENKLNLPHSTLSIICMYMAHFCKDNQDTISANLFFDKSQSLFNPQNKQPIQNILQFYLLSCDFYEYQKKYDKAEALLERALLANTGNDIGFLNQIKHRQAKLLMNKNEVTKAIDILTELLAQFNEHNFEEKTEIIALNIDLSKALVKQNNWDLALVSCQNAIAISQNFNATDFKTNPSVSDVLSKKALLDILNLKTDILLKLSTNNAGTYLIPAFETAQLGIKLIDSIRVDYTADFDKANLIATAYPIFEKCIHASYLLYEKTRDTSYILAAYQAVEQSKALLLLEGLKGVEAETVLLEADRNLLFQLRSELTSLEKKRNEEKNQNLENENYRQLQSNIFDTNRQFDALIKTFETRYPAYFKLKFDRQLPNIQQVQRLLKAHQTLVEYFVGDSSLFVFIIKSNHYELKEIKKDFPLDEWVKLLRGSLNAHNFQFQADVYADMANRLYVKLIQPFKTQLTEEIILIPDGILGYIPFEALLMTVPEKVSKFQTHAYLLRDHSISYSFSATLLREMMQKKHQTATSKTIITYAPFFNGDTTKLDSIFVNNVAMRRGFAPLSNSGEEAYSIAKIMNGEAIIGEKATENNFIKTAQSARILHLATHGKADDKSGDYSYLAFTRIKDSADYDLLYVRDLYNLTLNADMVVLSACETGIGKLQRGEGIISLARAFAYAGAKSIVTSLWAVNDAKTKDLMLFFYKNVKKGLSKDAALRAAKLSLIDKKNNSNLHPFFWAGFIGIGDMSKIFEK